MKDFLTYLRHLFYTLMLVRHVLVALFGLMLVGAGFIAFAEGMDFWKALYLTLITGLTVGYGDIAPTTVLGRIVSVLVGLTGLIFFGIVVAAANRALANMVQENREARKDAEHAEKQIAKEEAQQTANRQ